MNTISRFAVTLVVFCLSLGSLLAADWPGFRGLRGGVTTDKDLPTDVGPDNVLWKIRLPGAGTSSPIIVGDKVIVTCNAGYGTSITKGMGGGGFIPGGGGFEKGKGKGKGFGGKDTEAGDQSRLKLLVVCRDRASGEFVWQKELAPKLPETPFTGMMREHSYASSTPVTDGENIYVFFGKSGVHAFDLDGKKLWSADVGSTTHMWGSAASPILYKDILIVNAAIESKSLVGLNKNTGKEVWRQKGLGTTWASPVLVETKDGKHEVVVNVPGKIAAYDPLTGKQLWTCQGVVAASEGGGSTGKGGFGAGLSAYTASTPVARDGIVYVIGGGGPAPVAAMAIKTGGSGEVTRTHVLWKTKAGACNCSPVLTGDYLCWVDGTVTCLNIADGKVAYKERLYDGKNEYVSAVATPDRIFALTRTDGLFVLATGGKFERFGRLGLKDDTSVFNASPAISDGKLYLRSNEYLYCIGKK